VPAPGNAPRTVPHASRRPRTRWSRRQAAPARGRALRPRPLARHDRERQPCASDRQTSTQAGDQAVGLLSMVAAQAQWPRWTYNDQARRRPWSRFETLWKHAIRGAPVPCSPMRQSFGRRPRTGSASPAASCEPSLRLCPMRTKTCGSSTPRLPTPTSPWFSTPGSGGSGSRKRSWLALMERGASRRSTRRCVRSVACSRSRLRSARGWPGAVAVSPLGASAS